MQNQKKKDSVLAIYQTKNGSIELRGDIQAHTLWANRMQMAEIFGVKPQTITKHLQHIYNEKELERKSTSSKMELVQDESGRMVKRTVDIYNLDAIIAVGYRINSIMGTQFRIIDGNKRSGAFAFIWFLRRNGVRGRSKY